MGRLHAAVIVSLSAGALGARVDDDVDVRPHQPAMAEIDDDGKHQKIAVLKAEMAEMAKKIASFKGDEVPVDDVCSGFSPSSGPWANQGGSCDNWGSPLKWCFVDADYAGEKKQSDSYEGKFFAACQPPPVGSSVTPQEMAATVADTQEAVDKTEAAVQAVGKECEKAARNNRKQVLKNVRQVAKACQDKAAEHEAEGASGREDNERLLAVVEATKKERSEADRRAAEKSVIAKHAGNKVDAGMILAHKTESAKEAALRRKNGALKAFSEAQQDVDRLTVPAEKAETSYLEAQDQLKAATDAEEDAVATHAVAQRNAMQKAEEAHLADSFARRAIRTAKATKDATDHYHSIMGDKRHEAKKTEERALELLERQDAVTVEKQIADEELAKVEPMKQAKVNKAKRHHKVAEKAAKDAEEAAEVSASEMTIAQAAKEENHRASSKAFKAMYSKVKQEEKVLHHVAAEEKAEEDEAEGAKRHAVAEAEDAASNDTEATEQSSGPSLLEAEGPDADEEDGTPSAEALEAATNPEANDQF